MGTTNPLARTSVDRGLLEFVLEIGRYQMPVLPVMHKSLLTRTSHARPS